MARATYYDDDEIYDSSSSPAKIYNSTIAPSTAPTIAQKIITGVSIEIKSNDVSGKVNGKVDCTVEENCEGSSIGLCCVFLMNVPVRIDLYGSFL